MKNVSVILPVKFGSEWEIELAEFAINTMRAKTKQKFELIVAESGSSNLKDMADKHLKCAKNSNYVKDFNQAADLASHDYLVHIAIDIIVGDQWIEALLEPFSLYDDCGVTTVSTTEPGAVVGLRTPEKTIVEGMYGPIMMFKKEWRLDEAFSGLHSDSDLVMRLYEDGFRAYRNYRSVAYHLDGVTWRATTTEKERDKQRSEADLLFRTRYQDSPLWMAKMILRGGVLYGREHEQ